MRLVSDTTFTFHEKQNEVAESSEGINKRWNYIYYILEEKKKHFYRNRTMTFANNAMCRLLQIKGLSVKKNKLEYFRIIFQY